MRHIIALAGALALAGPTHAACPVESIVPGFQRFLTATAGLAPDARADRFITDYLPGTRDFYLIPGLPDTPATLRAKAARFFAGGVARAGLRPIDLPAAVTAGMSLEAALPAIQARFAAALPDFRCETKLVLGISLGRFDALALREGTSARLLFGVDTIARVHDAAGAAALVDHELFHLYQAQVMQDQPRGDLPVWWGMWLEGSATYAAGRLNPALPLQALLGYPPDLALRGAMQRGAIARGLLAELDATGSGYTRWFAADGAPPGGLPPRAAYYMGYRLAERLGRGLNLADLARVPPARVRAAAEAMLRADAGVG